MIRSDDQKRILVWLTVTVILMAYRSQLIDMVGESGMFAICLTIGLIGIGIAIDTMTHVNNQ